MANAIHQHKPIIVETGLLLPGDVICIRGTSFRSSIVRLLEIGDTDYSHVGIVVFKSGVPFVIHADPTYGGQGRVIKEPLNKVLAPDRASGAAFYRVSASTATIEEACAKAQHYADVALPFDHGFDLSTPDTLYCTELVWRAYFSAGIDMRGKWIYSGHKYLLPYDLIQSGLLKKVTELRE